MIHLYTAPTPNGHKISIALEELELPYQVHLVDIRKGEQFTPEFLAISPNNRIPAIVDEEGGPLPIFESGAILLYLAEKTGKLLPTDRAGRWSAIQWLMFQMGGLGPMLGQAHHFRQYAPVEIPYAIDRYTNEAHRLYRVMDTRLSQVEYLAGSYSIADISCWPWIRPYKRQGQELAEFPHLHRWFKEVGARPAVLRGSRIPETFDVPMDEEAKKVLFGQR